MGARATRARRYPQALPPLAAGPFTSLWDGADPTAAPPGAAKVLANVYCAPDGPGAPVVGRPGFGLLGSAAAPLGSVGVRTVQFIGEFTSLSGTTRSIAIVGGKFYTVNWGTEVWTETLTAAHFAAATGGAVTLSTTARFGAAVLGNQIVFSDGTNTMWMWNGTAGGGLTKLVNAPVLLPASMCVYYSKLFGIKATARGTMVWSEERDPATGYDVGGYNNAWDFDVTGTQPLTALAATNESLYVFRAREIASVTGRVNDDFETSGTRAAVSENIGTSGFVLSTARGVWFCDTDGRPHLIAPGGGVVPLWQGCAETLQGINRTALGAVCIVPHPEIDAVLIGLPLGQASGPSHWLVYRQNGDTLALLVGIWSGWTSQTAGLCLDANGRPTLVHGGDGDGFLYDHGHTDGARWDDTRVITGTEVTTPIAHIVTAHPVRPTVDMDVSWQRWTWLVRAVSEGPYTTRVRVPRGQNAPLSVTITGGTGSRLGVGRTGSFVLAGEVGEGRVVVGLNQTGRWLEPTLSHSEAGQRFACLMGAGMGYDMGTDPAIL